MRRLLPNPVESVTAAEEYSRPGPSRLVDGRAWLGVCMVSSLDGSTVVDGRSGALSSPADVSVLVALRNAADVILVGAGTVRAEGYGPPKKQGQRIGVVSRTGRGIDFDTPLFAGGHAFMVLPTSAPVVPVESARHGDTDVDFGGLLGSFPGAFVQAEGGATLNAALLDADLVDELNLTISPRLTGGEGPRLTAGAHDVSARYDLAHVLEDDGFLFTRYVRQR